MYSIIHTLISYIIYYYTVRTEVSLNDNCPHHVQCTLLLSILFCLIKKGIYVCVCYTDLRKVGYLGPLAFILGDTGATGGSEQRRDVN